ncbi:hypothetical protein MNBD_GAMMA13-712 [hydrothermal vent metagenome]|uniref:Uncharacterized protein n=1 Tax=hydrothermal vent metagenome TaxID=652676 RepID=A0A3B0Z6G7_9ZZZZ
MTQLYNIAPWAALWVLLTVVGNFIDRYHIRKNWHSKAQSWLTTMYLFLYELPKKFESGSRTERKLGKKGIVVSWIYGVAFAAIIMWWADHRAVSLLTSREFDSAYWSNFAIGIVQGLLAGVVMSFCITFILSLLYGAMMLFLYLTRFIVMEILSVASDPQNSPFSYTGSLLGIIAAALKLLYEWTK